MKILNLLNNTNLLNNNNSAYLLLEKKNYSLKPLNYKGNKENEQVVKLT